MTASVPQADYCISKLPVKNPELPTDQSTGSLPGGVQPFWLFLLLLVAFSIRLIAVAAIPGVWTPPVPGSDESEYDAIAWNLAQGRGYRGPSPDVDDQEHITAYRTPTTPLLFALIYTVTGHNYLAVHVVDSLLSVLTLLPIYAIARRCFGYRQAWIAACVYAFYPLSIYFNLTLLSETHGALLVALFAWCCLPITSARGLPWAAGAGGVLGLLLLCKPGFVFLLPLFPLLGGLVFRTKLQLWLRAIVLLTTMFCVMAPWIVRNRMELHSWIPFGTGGGQLLLCGNNRIVVEDPALYGYSVMDNALPEYAAGLRAPNDEVRRDAFAKSQAMAWLKENPDKWFYLAQGKFLRLWVPLFYGQENRLVAAAVCLYYGVILVLFTIGVVPITVRFIREKNPALIMQALILATVICAVIFHGQHRYRFPIDSLCIVFASAVIVWICDAVQNRRPSEWVPLAMTALYHRRGILIAALGVLAVVIALWTWDQHHIEHYRQQTSHLKMEKIADAIRRFEKEHQRQPQHLAELVPDYLPNLDSLHCPTHSLGWHEYQVLKSTQPKADSFAISYEIFRDPKTSQLLLQDAKGIHLGRQNSVTISPISPTKSMER